MKRVLVLVMALALVGCKKSEDEEGPTFPDYDPAFTVVANAADGVNRPQDLDFHPALDRAGELWVINQDTSATGGSVAIIFGATEAEPEVEVRRDGNAWHFMSLPTAIAFSANTTNFATSPEITDANHAGGIFTGPTLWSSDLDIFAQPSGLNGSHLDMLHQSPNSMGIAHEFGDSDIFWIFDGYHEELVRYDFGHPHVPGGDDHSDGQVFRYSDVPIKRVEDVPSHMVHDAGSEWMYIADTAGGRILRVDVDSGTEGAVLPPLNGEPLNENVQMKGEVWEVFADGLQAPSGIDVHDGMVLVSDNATSEIIAFDIDSGDELGRFEVPARDLMGIKVGPDDLIYFVDRKGHRVMRVERG